MIHPGQLPIQSLMLDREKLMIDSQEMKHGGMVALDLVPDRVIARFVGFPIADPPLTPPPAIHIEKPW